MNLDHVPLRSIAKCYYASRNLLLAANDLSDP